MRPVLHMLVGQLMVGPMVFAEFSGQSALPSARDCLDLLARTSLDEDQVIELLSAGPNLREARVRVLTVGAPVRSTVVLVGENHHAWDSDIRALRPLLDEFSTIFTENGSTNDDATWSYRTIGLARVLTAPHRAGQRVFTGRRLVSAMDLARFGRRLEGRVRNLERSHAPHWSEEAHLVTLASLSALRSLVAAIAWAAGEDGRTRTVSAGLAYVDYIMERFDRDLPLTRRRDRTMAREIHDSTREKESGPSSLVVVGLVHLDNIVEELVTRHGFIETIAPSNRVDSAETWGLEL